MAYKMLLVDDDENLLSSYRRQLRKKFETDTALSGPKGLEYIAEGGPYCIVISDFRMPGMDGIQFLNRVREASPDSIRILLTGYADIETATRAVNENNVFRLLTKPCSPDVFSKALLDGIRQYRLITGERELLEKTLNGCIKMLTEILAMARPEAFSRASRITRYVNLMSRVLDDPAPWQTDMAARLSQIGLIMVPDVAWDKLNRGKPLTPEEKRIQNEHPALASNLLANIPRMEEIAEIVAYQKKNYDGTGIPNDGRAGEMIPLGSRILRVAVDFDYLTAAGGSKGEAYIKLKRNAKSYDPKVIRALALVLGDEIKYNVKSLPIRDLRERMILAEDVFLRDGGKLVLARGHELTEPIVDRFRKYHKTLGIREPVKVLLPIEIV